MKIFSYNASKEFKCSTQHTWRCNHLSARSYPLRKSCKKRVKSTFKDIITMCLDLPPANDLGGRTSDLVTISFGSISNPLSCRKAVDSVYEVGLTETAFELSYVLGKNPQSANHL
ncbi:PREDICTED: uncharacterized protein LOC104604164 [Nelumbo nucifera]|uniref:Uncharacterized protein LOC104604164 n=1 Tax=Nelumbo nucifera TaxID=4432 RepID=A0A1U8AUX0_NELNU|nr:PREDICTED: uncharacterized protein LOC104604164 [Nelumbo nucifera]